MEKIRKCVKDIVHIARNSEDFGRAKERIEQLFVETKAQHRDHLETAQEVRDQLEQAYDDMDAQEFLDKVIEWLDRECLRQRLSDR